MNIIKDIFDSLLHIDFFNSSFYYMLRVAIPVLVVVGIIKLFSKSKKEISVDIEKGDLDLNSIKKKGMLFLCLGVLSFLLAFIFKSLIVTGIDAGSGIAFFAVFVMAIPILILVLAGFVLIVLGLDKLSKYFRHKRLLKTDKKI